MHPSVSPQWGKNVVDGKGRHGGTVFGQRWGHLQLLALHIDVFLQFADRLLDLRQARVVDLILALDLLKLKRFVLGFELVDRDGEVLLVAA